MANKKVTVVRLCKTPEGWKRLSIVMGRNGKVRSGYALYNGVETLLPDGRYQLRTYEGKKTVYEDVGEDGLDALKAQQRKSTLMVAKSAAGAAGVKIVDAPALRLNLSKKRDEYIQRHLAKGQLRASETSLVAIDGFLLATGCTYADQVDEASVLKFYTHLRAAGNADRTIYNKHMSLFAFFRWLKMDTKLLADTSPAYTEKEVETYHAEDLRILFESCSGYNRVVLEFLLKTGLRMQEAMHIEWPNIDFRKKMVRVREMLDGEQTYDVRIKDRAERSLPLPDDLAATLLHWKDENPGTRLVLGTKNDTPNWKWLQMLKRAVRRAGLNCGRCTGCKVTQECSRWKIHKFRATYTTTLLRNGVDARTVMSYTGHEDLATVLRYLQPAEDAPMQKKVSAITWM